MKKIVLAAFLCALLIQCKESQTKNSGPLLSQKFSSDTLKLSFDYPVNWKIIQNPDYGNAVVLLENKEDSNDPFQESMQIWVEEMPVAVQDSVFFQAALTQLKITNPNLQIQPGGAVKLGDNNFSSFSFHFTPNDKKEYTVKGYCLVKDKTGYNFSCTALRADMKKHEETFSAILKSFKPL